MLSFKLKSIVYLFFTIMWNTYKDLTSVMFWVVFLLLFFVEVLSKKAHDYRIDNRKLFSPGHICNYEAYFLNYPQFVLYTCVHESKCKGGDRRSVRRPELHFDNCPMTFHPPEEGGNYVCCHPGDNEATKHNGNATLAPLQLRYMPGFRSAFKCNDYAKLVCLNDKFCPQDARRESKGGTETLIGKYPHLAVIGWYNDQTKGQNWFCLGSIVSERFVLSAASCREDKDGNFANFVRVGESALCKIGVDCAPSKFAQHLRVDKQFHHPSNVLGWYYHDIMLFKLDRNIKFNSQVRPACIFSVMNTYQAGGMFAMYEDGSKDMAKQTIHEMEIQVFNTEACKRWFASDIRLAEPKIDNEIMFCAGLPQAKKVPCTNDYGGPLQIQEEAPYCMWQVYGVMAWSQTFFCKGSKPAMFTRVPYYLDWIEEVIWYDFNLLIEHDTCSDHCTDSLGVPRGPEGRCPG